MKLMLYTTLHVKNQPVAYKIYFHPGEKKYYFKTDRPHLEHPSFYVWHFRRQWLFEGINNPYLQEQAIEDMQNVLEMNERPIM